MAVKFSSYNGYDSDERTEHLMVLKRLINAGELAPAIGPCALCCDPNAPVEYHSEDYSKPYRWTPPATYPICLSCHRSKLHTRFRWPQLWFAFLAHVRRGGYARDLHDPAIKREFATYRALVARGEKAILRQLRPYKKIPGSEWFANLRMDESSKEDPAARPR